MLIGRTRELDVLTQCLDDALASGGRSCFLTGEPGIGKSTLLAAVAEVARQRGVRVASIVSSDAAWSLPYTPWFAILEQLGHGPGHLQPPDDADVSPGDYHARVHREVLAALREVAARQPMVIVFDDIQWMDQPSRDLLVHAIRELDAAPVLCLGAWRTPVSDRDPEFAARVADLRRQPGATWMELAGMDDAGVAVIARDLGWEASPTAIGQVTARTNGNPFFVTEVARLMAERGTPTLDGPDPAIPPSVQQVVRARFNDLPDRTREMLGVASVLTQGFDFDFLREMTGLAEADLLDALDDALDRDFLHPTDSRPEHYDFTHQIVRESIAATWSPSRRVRLHRRAAETLERTFADRTDAVAGDLALQYYASRSLAGAERGIGPALARADQALHVFDFGQAVTFLDMASELALGQPLAVRAGIESRRALALVDAVRIDAAVESAERAVDMLAESGAPPDDLADTCWKLAHALNAVGANPAVRKRLQRIGLAALGRRRDLHWARLRLLDDAIVVVPHEVLYVARWVGYDQEALQIVRQSGREDDLVQTIESFDPRNRFETRNLVSQARGWRAPRATLRGLTAAANDLTYRHGEFRQAMRIWHEILGISREIGAVPWQANALNQVTLLHVTLGEFEQAVTSKRLADDVNATLGPANDAEALVMERDFALTHYLDGDWAGQAAYWLAFVGDPPQGLETQLAAPLYAAMAASAAASAGVEAVAALRLVDAVTGIAAEPGIQQVNGVVAWTADAVYKLAATARAARLDRLAAALIAAGTGNYPQTSLLLTRARMCTLLGDPQAHRLFEQARETLASEGQLPLTGIACYEQAIAPSTSPESRKRLLRQGIDLFERLSMTAWHERATSAAVDAPRVQLEIAGVSRRELEVIGLVAQGYPDRKIADTLFISERTVHAHLRNILRKTDTANRTELSMWARARGILDA